MLVQSLNQGVVMYHAIVRRRIRALFDAVSSGNAAPVLEAFAPQFEHFFLGDHALGGSRKTLAATKAWYDRLYRLLPDIRFVLRETRISGPPWNTLVVVDWDETNSGTDGVKTHNRGIHVVRLAWGRATFLGIYPDTVGLVETLDRLALAGNNEAHAAVIIG
jgi:ketosteroid isomerase-like protein